MIKFFEDHQHKKRKAIDLSHRSKPSQEVNALLDKDYKPQNSARRKNTELKRADSKQSDDKEKGQKSTRMESSKEADIIEPSKSIQKPALGKQEPKIAGKEKVGRGISLNSESTKMTSGLSSTQTSGGLTGGKNPSLKSKLTAPSLAGQAKKR